MFRTRQKCERELWNVLIENFAWKENKLERHPNKTVVLIVETLSKYATQNYRQVVY